MVLESIFEDKPFYPDLKSYCQLLLTCAIACEISYETDPLAKLNNSYHNFKHGIKKICSSITNDMENTKATLETRYLIADCSDEKIKRLVVAIRGSYSKSDILTDVKLIPAINDTGYGVLHSGFLERAKVIPLEYFYEKVNEGYEVIFTGHSMGGAVGAIITARLLSACEVKANRNPPIQFIGFGVPLLADTKFNERIQKNKHINHFHFYINENDFVPRSISLVSEIVRVSAESDLIDQVANFLKAITSYISPMLGLANQELMSNSISVFQWFTKALAKIYHNYSPKFSPFGNHIHISYEKNMQLLKEHQEDIYDIKEKFDVFNKDKIEMIQNHKMKNYFDEVLKICDKFDCKISSLISYFTATRVTLMKDLYVPQNWTFVPPEWLKKQDDNFDAFEGNNCYSVRMIANDANMDIHLSLISKKFVNYITNVEITYPICRRVSVHEEKNGLTYCFSGSISQIWCKKKLLVPDLRVVFTTHFNSFELNIPIKDNVIPETGQTVKEERISKLPTDLLYMYALSFIFATSTVEDESIKNQRTQITKLLADLDDLNDETTSSIKIDDQELNMKLLRMFFEGTNDQVGNLGKIFQLEFSFSTKLAKLSQETSTFHELVYQNFVTVLHHNSIQCSLIKELFTEKLGMSVSGAGLTISAGVCAGLLFVPGINIFAIAGLIATGVVSAASFAAFVAAYIRKNRDKLDYEQNLKTLMDGFGINYSHTIPTLYHYEKLIFEWAWPNLFQRYGNNDMKIQENWSQAFPGFTGTIKLITIEDRKKVLRILRSVCINYEIRKELMQNFYIGVVGMKKCGKSTFVEKLLHKKANASSHIATTEIKAYPLTSNSSNFAIWDFPHYESQDPLHKLQFITSRFLLDYVIVVYDAISECDKEECKEHINVIKQSNNDRFLVIMNKADNFYKDNITREVFDEKRRKSATNLGVDKSRIIFSSVDPSISNVHELKPLGLHMMKEVREIIWNDLLEIGKHRVIGIEKEWDTLKKHDALKVVVEFRRKGKSSALELKWNEVKTMGFNELLNHLKEEYEHENIKITSRSYGEEITTMSQLLEHEDHRFEVELV